MHNARKEEINVGRNPEVTGREHRHAIVCLLSTDAFFAMRIRPVLQHLGLTMKLYRNEADLVTHSTDAGLILVDFNGPVEWEALTPVIRRRASVIAFGAHTNVDGFRRAKGAGVTRVVSNGELSRSLPDLIGKYMTASQ